MRRCLYIINGPNLKQVGMREPEVYGTRSLSEYIDALAREYDPREIDIFSFFFTHEGDIIDKLYEAQERGVDGVILNIGAYTHTSLAIADCLRAVNLPAIEVHISNVFARESYRHTSWIAPCCIGSIIGLGIEGYRLAVEAFFLRFSTSI